MSDDDQGENAEHYGVSADKGRQITWVQIAVVLLAAAGVFVVYELATSDDGPTQAEQEAERVSAARAQVTEEECKEEVELAADEEETEAAYACRQAGWDPVWEVHGIHATTEDYERYAKTAAAGPARDPLRPLVTYKVEGTASSGDITYSTPSGTQQQSGVDIPLTRKSDGGKGLEANMPAGDFLYLSVQNNGSSGSVTCIIEVNGREIARNTSSGAYVIATCEGVA